MIIFKIFAKKGDILTIFLYSEILFSLRYKKIFANAYMVGASPIVDS